MTRLSFVFFALAYASALAQENAGLSVDPGAKNVAALFTMTDEGGRLRNLELMQSVFKDRSLGFDLETHHNVSSTFIYSRLEELVRVSDEWGTLLVYLNSHGGGSGDRFAMTAKGGSFKFSKALEAMKKPGKKLKRLILLVDTCHAEGSIQDSLKQDGDLLKNIKFAVPTSELPVLPSRFSISDLPFISVFVDPVVRTENGRRFFEASSTIDYGEDSGVYEEMLIISSCSVEDLSIRGVFASRLASTFEKIKEKDDVTLGGFLKMFAESHGKSGQQPHYKAMPDDSMFASPLFGPWPAQTIPVVDHTRGESLTPMKLIPVPRR
jgi:hypothetical protein